MVEGKKISELGLVTSINDGCCFPLLSNGATKRITFAVLLENIIDNLVLPENQQIKELKEKISNIDTSIELTDQQVEKIKKQIEEIQKDVDSQDEIIVKYLKLFEELKDAYDRVEVAGGIIDDELDETSEHAIQNKVIAKLIPEQASEENKLADKDYVEKIPTVKNFFKSNVTRMIAHRGLSSIAPENTIPAYKLAGDFGYWGGETDLMKTKDGHFVCFHDTKLDRLTNGSGNLYDYTLAELKELQFNQTGHYVGMGFFVEGDAVITIPTFEEYLIACKKYNLVPIIEIKTDENITNDDMTTILEIVDKWEMTEQVVFIGWAVNNTFLKTIHDLNPKVHCQPIMENFTKETIDWVAENFGPNCGIDQEYNQITKELVDYAHNKGVEVNCWTVDDEETKEKLISWGVDYITTNKLLNINLPEMKIGALSYELGGTERVVDIIQKIFELETETENKIFCSNPQVGGINSYIPQNSNDIKTGTSPYERFILTASATKNNTIFLKRALDKTKVYLNEKTIYVGGGDFTKYKMTLYPFNEKGKFLADLGWFTQNCYVSLPPKTTFVLFYFARVDGADITSDDLLAMKNFYICKTNHHRYIKLSCNLFYSGGAFPAGSVLNNLNVDKTLNRMIDINGINVSDFNKLKVSYVDDSYSITAYCFKYNENGKLIFAEDLGWSVEGTEYTIPTNSKRMYFLIKRNDNANLTALDVLKITQNIIVEVY